MWEEQQAKEAFPPLICWFLSLWAEQTQNNGYPFTADWNPGIELNSSELHIFMAAERTEYGTAEAVSD